MISVVIPVLNEESGIDENINEITKHIPCEYELIVVDDGSQDGTWEKIKAMSVNHPEIIGVRFSRNFGKEAALIAGIHHAKGDAVITMDSDLQHPPEYIPLLIEKWQEGYKIVEIRKSKRVKESLGYRLVAKMFYQVLQKLSGLDMNNSSDYQLLDKKVVKAIKEFKEGQLFFRGLVDWVGFDKFVMEKEFHDRTVGKSKFHFKSLSKLALNAITSFSSSLLYLTSILGTIFFIVAIVLGIQTIVNKVTGRALEGFTSVILLQLTIGSLMMFCLSIMGLYIGKIYQEVKNRPQFIVSETTKE